MKQAIRVGLIVLVLGGGSLLVWKVQHDGWTIQGQDPTEFILSGFDSVTVMKVKPFMPPVIELVDEQQSAAESGGYSDSDPESTMEIDMDKPSLDEINSGLVPEKGPPDEGEESDTRERREELVAQNYDQNTLDVIFHAEKKADSQALKILQIGRELSLESKEIVQGGCWDYVDTVYSRAGYTGDQRRGVFQGGEETERYADRDMILPGDWLFYINHNYRETRHSAIFVDWIDYEKHMGLMLSYGCEGRGEPARYRAYDLSHVYNIVRPVKK
jgi:hypothetical protein